MAVGSALILLATASLNASLRIPDQLYWVLLVFLSRMCSSGGWFFVVPFLGMNFAILTVVVSAWWSLSTPDSSVV